jgi:hypothetical protein
MISVITNGGDAFVDVDEHLPNIMWQVATRILLKVCSSMSSKIAFLARAFNLFCSAFMGVSNTVEATLQMSRDGIQGKPTFRVSNKESLSP